MKNLKKILAVLLAGSMLMVTACGNNSTTAEENVVTTPAQEEQTVTEQPVSIGTETSTGEDDTRDISEKYPDAHVVVLSADGSVTIDGETVEEFDYAWHADPSVDHDEVKNCPAEYYTGTEPETDAALYIAHDIFYYPQLDESGFTKVAYDGETEWCYYYTAEGYENYIFATLPVQKTGFPSQMMHTEEEAYANPVLHITQPGQYVLQGQWNGQIWIDLGDSDDTFADENAKATVILNGVDVTCTVAPALVFYSAYECDNTWEDREEYSSEVDLTNAGARVIICDGSENNFDGTNVYRMLKTKFKSEDESYQGQPQKKARKTDGAFYSYVSMVVEGEAAGSGVLNIEAGFEGLDTELHLAINGGNVNIFSQDDGINVNEDGVSVVTFNGGNVHILGGLGSEGDGVDSNGFLVVNGGTVIASASPMSDSGLDSDCGSYIYGGSVLALGSTMDWAESDGTDSTQAVMNLRFSSYENADEEIEIKDEGGSTVFFYEPEDDAVVGGNARQYMGAVISAPGLEVGKTYTVYVGGVQQGYSSTGELGFGGFGGQGGFGGFGGAGGQQGQGGTFDPSQMGQGGQQGSSQDGTTAPATPDGTTAPTMPDGTTAPTMPDGTTFDPSKQGSGQPGQQGQGGTFDPSQMGQGGQQGSSQDGTTAPTMPDGTTATTMPDGTTAPTMPDGTTAPTMPDGTTFDPSQMGQQGGFDPNSAFGGTTASGDLTPEFVLEDTVNGFSGVGDYSAAE